MCERFKVGSVFWLVDGKGMSSTLGKLEFDSVIIRFGGEMGIKGDWTRRIYEHRLLENVKSTLKRDKIVHKGFLRKHGRLYLKTSSVTEASLSLSKVFGISSISPAVETSSRLEEIVSACTSLAKLTFKRGNAFAVRCKRVGNQPYSSRDVCREVGQRILDELSELKLNVNLDKPDVTFGIDIRDEIAFIHSTVVAGVGGLPLGTQPKVVCLLSEDFESSVASWLAMKRGCPIVPVYFENSLSSEAITAKVVENAKVLFDWAAGFPRKIYVVPNTQNLALLEGECPKNLVSVLIWRLMYSVSERICQIEKAEGIVTGETIGENPSRTLRIMRLSNTAIREFPVHRPLVGFDKSEIQETAGRIGIRWDQSAPAHSHSAIIEDPSTVILPDDLAQAEAELKMKDMVEKSVESLRILRL